MYGKWNCRLSGTDRTDKKAFSNVSIFHCPDQDTNLDVMVWIACIVWAIEHRLVYRRGA